MARGSDSLFLRGGAESLRGWSATDDQELRHQERRRATRNVAALAHDAADCALLLDVLGLDPTEGKTTS
jgi:hypothetical protein